jgi:hypothetical protein
MFFISLADKTFLLFSLCTTFGSFGNAAAIANQSRDSAAGIPLAPDRSHLYLPGHDCVLQMRLHRVVSLTATFGTFSQGLTWFDSTYWSYQMC